MTGELIAGFRVWGNWVEQPPPPIGNDPLTGIAHSVQPLLLIIDPLRYAHSLDENDSADMMGIMQWLRSYAVAGAAVLVVHHVARSEGSTSRGSTAIRAGVDVALLEELDDKTGLVTLRVNKNRFGERRTMTIKPDYHANNFVLLENPQAIQEAEELQRLCRIISTQPGFSASGIVYSASRERGCHLGRCHAKSEGLRQDGRQDPQDLRQI